MFTFIQFGDYFHEKKTNKRGELWIWQLFTINKNNCKMHTSQMTHVSAIAPSSCFARTASYQLEIWQIQHSSCQNIIDLCTGLHSSGHHNFKCRFFMIFATLLGKVHTARATGTGRIRIVLRLNYSLQILQINTIPGRVKRYRL